MIDELMQSVDLYAAERRRSSNSTDSLKNIFQIYHFISDFNGIFHRGVVFRIRHWNDTQKKTHTHQTLRS